MMNERELLQVLRIVKQGTQHKIFPWRLDGSANLLVQGVNTPVGDVDICTNLDGLRIFKKGLEQYPQQEHYNERIKARSLIVNINGQRVEINCYDEYELRMLNKVISQSWEGLTLPTLPLPESLDFYRKIHRLDKVKVIEDHLQEHKVLREHKIFPG